MRNILYDFGSGTSAMRGGEPNYIQLMLLHLLHQEVWVKSCSSLRSVFDVFSPNPGTIMPLETLPGAVAPDYKAPMITDICKSHHDGKVAILLGVHQEPTYRKLTHMDQYLLFDSNHSLEHKLVVIRPLD